MPSAVKTNGTSPPDLHIPPSQSTVKVSIIDTTARVSNLPTNLFIEPDIPGLEYLKAPTYSFLIENEAKDQKILFDLGIRKDMDKLPEKIHDLIKDTGAKVTAPHNVSEILSAHNIPLSSISSIIWSHHHWDHTGDPSRFPPSTTLTVGPGFKSAFLPGYPSNPDSPVTDDAFANRTLTEISFDTGLQLGRFDALDYFGDGSFYLLDTPGHSVGHICGLARTSVLSDSFIFMGGDAAHHGAELRPTEYLRLPAEIGPSPYERLADVRGRVSRCPGEVFLQVHPQGRGDVPFVAPKRGVTTDAEGARESLVKIAEFDAREDVLVVLAHDAGLLELVDVFPKTANGWREKGWREEGLWRFLGDFRTSRNEGGKVFFEEWREKERGV